MLSEGSAGATARQGRPHRDALGAGWVVPLLLAGFVAVGLALRLPSFGDSLYGDEVGTFYDVSGHGLGRVIHLLSGHAPEQSPPLYFVFAWISEQLFGSSVESLRLISLICGMAAIPLTYLLGRRTVGVRAGVVAAAIVALSPFQVYYSTEARGYALLVVLCLLSTLALLKAIETGGRAWWVVYAAASCAAIYTHYTAVFVLILQFGWAFVTHPNSRRGLAVATLAAAAGFLPWLPNLIDTANSPGPKLYSALDPFTLHSIRIDLGLLWLGFPHHSITTIPGSAAIGLALAGLGVAAVGAVLGSRGGRLRDQLARPPARLALVALLAIGVPVAVGLYSSVRLSVWDSRNLITSWPALAVLLGALLTWPRAGIWRFPAMALVFAAVAIGSVKSLAREHHKPDYRAAADFVSRTGSDNEPVVNWPDYSPGPPVELEVAFDDNGSARRHPVLRLGAAPLAEVRRAPPFAKLLPQTGEEVAREAVRLARAGRIFLVLPSPVPVSQLEAARRKHITSRPTDNILVLLAAFLGTLPARFHFVAVHTYQGLHRVTLYALQG